MYEFIPFKAFVAGSITPAPHVLSLLDGGLTFFIGTGAVILGLVALEKFGLPINEQTVRFLMWGSILFFLLWFVFKNPLIRSLTFGF